MEFTIDSSYVSDTATAFHLNYDTVRGNGYVIVTLDAPTGNVDIRVPLSLVQQALNLFYNAPPS
jgi:hypothetical protein